jgi:hypothetical protein
MKRLLLFFSLGISVFITKAQQSVSIGSEQIKPNAVLYLSSPQGNQGLIVPLVKNLQNVTGEKGMIVYDESTNTLYYHDHEDWIAVVPGGGQGGKEVDGVVGNEVKEVIAGRGLEITGNKTSASPAAVGLIAGNADGQVLKWNNTEKKWELSTIIPGATYTQGQGIIINANQIAVNTGAGLSFDGTGKLQATDQSNSNEIQNLTTAGSAGSAVPGEIFQLNISGGTGISIQEGSNVQITQSANTLTIGSVGGVGEANTASNLGGGGSVGIFKQKNGVNFEFKSLNAATSGKISLNNDVPNNEIDIDVNQGALSIATSQLTGTLDPTQLGGSIPVNKLLAGSNGQVLQTIGGVPTWGPPTTATLSMDNLTDATVSAPASGQILIHNGTSDFVNRALTGDISLANTGLTSIANNGTTGTNIVNSINNAGTTTTIGANRLTSSVLLDTESPAGGDLGGTYSNLTINNTGAAGTNILTAINNGAATGTIPLVRGGTGATTLAGARTNLGFGAVPANGQILIGNAGNYTAANVSTTTGVIVTPGAGTLDISTSGNFGAQNLTTTGTFSSGNITAPTINLNTLSYTWPVAHNAANSVLLNNGTGTLSWGAVPSPFNTNNIIPKGDGTALAASNISDNGSLITLNAATQIANNAANASNTGLLISVVNATNSNIGINSLVTGGATEAVGIRGSGSNTTGTSVGLRGIAQNSISNMGVQGQVSNAAAGSSNYGVLGQSTPANASLNYGVAGSASGGNFAYGVAGSASGALKNYSIYGTAALAPNSWAGYFVGGVAIDGPLALGNTENFGTAGQVLTSQGSGSPPQWAAASSSGAGSGLTFNSPNIDLGGTITNSPVFSKATGDNMFAIESADAAINTKAGLNFKMFNGTVGTQYELVARKNNGTTGDTQADFLLLKQFSTAGGFIEMFKVDNSSNDFIVNSNKTSTSSYGNFIVENGLVGIGVPSPLAKLDVDGDVRTTADYTYAAAKTRNLSVNQAAFNLASTTSTVSTKRGTNSGNPIILTTQNGTPGTQTQFVAPVSLPDGAIVTNVYAMLYDADGTFNGTIRLVRQSLNPNGFINSNIASITTSGSAGQQNPSTTSITNATINNGSFSYFLVFETTESNVDIGLYGVRITYAVDQAD